MTAFAKKTYEKKAVSRMLQKHLKEANDMVCMFHLRR